VAAQSLALTHLHEPPQKDRNPVRQFFRHSAVCYHIGMADLIFVRFHETRKSAKAGQALLDYGGLARLA